MQLQQYESQKSFRFTVKDIWYLQENFVRQEAFTNGCGHLYLKVLWLAFVFFFLVFFSFNQAFYDFVF